MAVLYVYKGSPGPVQMMMQYVLWVQCGEDIKPGGMEGLPTGPHGDLFGVVGDEP